MNYRIITYEEKYRDDLIFMVLEAKNALGKVPSINPDLLSIQQTYFDKGDMFWLAVDENDRVIGSIGYSSIENSNDVWLHRLYIKCDLKRHGLGSALLKFVENYLVSIGKETVHVHLGDEKFFESKQFYPKHGYEYYASRYMKKRLIPDYSEIVGKCVKGVIDRPIGSRHPDYSDIVYTVNYGCIPEISGGDGEPQDVYLLGVSVPVNCFQGKVIAVYHRFDDNEDKWIVADNNDFTEDEILSAINFQEKYFKGRLYR